MKEIKPIGAFEGEFELPGDKSITHRAVMLNAGAEGEAVVTHALMGGTASPPVSVCARSGPGSTSTERRSACTARPGFGRG